MAAPLAAKILLPDDSGNTGKLVRTQTRVVGADTVHEHYWVQVRLAQVLGVYRGALPQQTVLASAQNGTTTGFLWAHMPTAVSNVKARIRRLYVSSQHSSALATPTAPRLLIARFTFTGTSTGANVTAAKVDSGQPTPKLVLATAVTGLSPALVSNLGVAGLAGALTAVGAYVPLDFNVIDPASDEDEWPVIAPGEGVVIYQDVAGTTSDTRKFNPVLLWDEIDTA